MTDDHPKADPKTVSEKGTVPFFSQGSEKSGQSPTVFASSQPTLSTNQGGQAASEAPVSSAEPVSKEVVKAAYLAFKKRWKLTRLDQESRIGRGPMSSGQKSTIIGIQPPNQFPDAVWELLVEQGKLKRAGRDQYAMS